MKCFSELLKKYEIKPFFITLESNFDRDLAMSDFFQRKQYQLERITNARVIRKLKSRQNWDKRWEDVMRAEPKYSMKLI
jgi:deoxyribodipyrimidine photo-lyase